MTVASRHAPSIRYAGLFLRSERHLLTPCCLLERGRARSTYLGNGVVAPNVLVPSLEKPVLVFARFENGVPLPTGHERASAVLYPADFGRSGTRPSPAAARHCLAVRERLRSRAVGGGQRTLGGDCHSGRSHAGRGGIANGPNPRTRRRLSRRIHRRATALAALNTGRRFDDSEAGSVEGEEGDSCLGLRVHPRVWRFSMRSMVFAL
jgi:hypothetical protein